MDPPPLSRGTPTSRSNTSSPLSNKPKKNRQGSSTNFLKFGKMGGSRKGKFLSVQPLHDVSSNSIVGGPLQLKEDPSVTDGLPDNMRVRTSSFSEYSGVDYSSHIDDGKLKKTGKKILNALGIAKFNRRGSSASGAEKAPKSGKTSRSNSFDMGELVDGLVDDKGRVTLKKRSAAVLEAPSSQYLSAFAKWYYVDLNGNSVGPQNAPAIVWDYREGNVTSESFVWRAGMSEWKKLKEVEELKFLTDDKVSSDGDDKLQSFFQKMNLPPPDKDMNRTDSLSRAALSEVEMRDTSGTLSEWLSNAAEATPSDTDDYNTLVQSETPSKQRQKSAEWANLEKELKESLPEERTLSPILSSSNFPPASSLPSRSDSSRLLRDRALPGPEFRKNSVASIGEPTRKGSVASTILGPVGGSPMDSLRDPPGMDRTISDSGLPSIETKDERPPMAIRLDTAPEPRRPEGRLKALLKSKDIRTLESGALLEEVDERRAKLTPSPSPRRGSMPELDGSRLARKSSGVVSTSSVTEGVLSPKRDEKGLSRHNSRGSLVDEVRAHEESRRRLTEFLATRSHNNSPRTGSALSGGFKTPDSRMRTPEAISEQNRQKLFTYIRSQGNTPDSKTGSQRVSPFVGSGPSSRITSPGLAPNTGAGNRNSAIPADSPYSIGTPVSSSLKSHGPLRIDELVLNPIPSNESNAGDAESKTLKPMSTPAPETPEKGVIQRLVNNRMVSDQSEGDAEETRVVAYFVPPNRFVWKLVNSDGSIAHEDHSELEDLESKLSHIPEMSPEKARRLAKPNGAPLGKMRVLTVKQLTPSPEKDGEGQQSPIGESESSFVGEDVEQNGWIAVQPRPGIDVLTPVLEDSGSMNATPESVGSARMDTLSLGSSRKKSPKSGNLAMSATVRHAKTKGSKSGASAKDSKAGKKPLAKTAKKATSTTGAVITVTMSSKSNSKRK